MNGAIAVNSIRAIPNVQIKLEGFYDILFKRSFV